MDDIKVQYQRIHDHLSGYTKQHVELNDVSAEGTVAEIYRDSHGAVRLVNVTSFGEMGKSEEAYYFHHNKLFFLYAVTTRYNAPFYAEGQFDPKRSKIFRDRYYFVHGKMSRWIDNAHKKISPTSKVFQEKEEEILSFITRHFIFLPKPSNAIGIRAITLKNIGKLMKGYKADYNHLFEAHGLVESSLIACGESDTEGTERAWIVKLSANGSLLWRREIEQADPGDLRVCACIPMGAKGYIVAGDRTIGGTGESDFWIQCLDAKGRTMWQKHYPKFPQDYTEKVVKRSDGGFVVIGFRDKEASETNLWAMKLDASGRKVQEKYLGEAEPSDTITITRSKTCDIMIVQKPGQKRAGAKRTMCLQL